MTPQFGVLGDGGQADEVCDYTLPNAPSFRAVSSQFLVPTRVELIDISTTESALLAIPVVAAVGAPGLRRQLVEDWQGSRYRSVIAPSAVVSVSATVGVGTILAPGSVVSTHVDVGNHVILNIGASISHDCVLGEFATISPGVRIAGNCRIGRGVFLGIGASVSQGITIGDGVVVGAGAVVTMDLSGPGVYVGTPARLIKQSEGWLYAI